MPLQKSRQLFSLFFAMTLTAQAKDCKIDTSSKKSIEASLQNTKWTLESWVWNGDLNFESGNVYSTSWGKGKWHADKHGSIYLINDYDRFSHVFKLSKDSYAGARNDGVQVKGRLNCGQLKDWDPSKLVMGNSAEEKAIAQFYRELLGREPDAQGFQYWVQVYRKGAPLELIKSRIMESPEYTARKVASQ